MEVTKANFEFVFPHFVKHLQSCSFVSFDLEMTGIKLPNVEEDLFAPAADHFLPKYEAAKRYNIIQLGVCLFHRADGKSDAPFFGPVDDTYTAMPFNFYAFPCSSDQDVTINTDTANFLLKHNMDFTKWITSGIPYMPLPKALEKRKTLESADPFELALKQSDAVGWSQDMLAQIPREDMNMFTELMAQIQTHRDECRARFAASASSPTATDAAVSPSQNQDEPVGVRLPFLKNRNTFNLLLQYTQHLGMCLNSHRTNRGQTINSVVSPLKAHQQAFSDLEKQIGLTRIFEALVNAKKPLLAHNSLSDHLFLHTAFDGRPLTDLESFKKLMEMRFPCIFDTRTLVTLPSVSYDHSVQQNLEGQVRHFRALKGNSVTLELGLGFEAYDKSVLESSSRAHEAAFDALITGELFLLAAHVLGGGDVAKLRQWENMIPVYRCLETIRLREPNEIVLHDGPVLTVQAHNLQLSAVRVDGLFMETALRGRVLWNHDISIVFSPKASRGAGFEGELEKARKKLSEISKAAAIKIYRE